MDANDLVFSRCPACELRYTCNANGIRTGKTVDGVAHTYTLDGANILKETWGENTLIPLRDNEEQVCGILYNGTPYYFLKNLQGDILAILDANGDTVATYTYDAWGVCTISSDTSTCSIATVNPFRYRGYYFDAEIGMYYLQSRYYDPVVGRFVSSDEVIMALMNKSASASNLFAYCWNSPTEFSDLYGLAPKASEVPPSSSGYVPPKGGPKKGRTKGGKTGWVDKNGNVWVPDPSNHGGEHWDVTGKDGYINVGRDGHAWGGKGKVKLPASAKRRIEFGKIVWGVFVLILRALLIVAIAALIYFTKGAAAVSFL